MQDESGRPERIEAEPPASGTGPPLLAVRQIEAEPPASDASGPPALWGRIGAGAPAHAGPASVRRVVRFLHHFAGPVCPFGLGEAIEKEAARQGVAVEVTSRDIKRDGADLLAAE
eukprot:5857023-Heterocapsa_arctica.AAC.1